MTNPAPNVADAPSQIHEEAQAAVLAHDARRAEWEARRDTLTARLTRREREAAGAALAGAATAKIAGELARLREEIAVAEGVLSLLAAQREGLVYGVRLAEFHDLCAQHDTLAAAEVAMLARIAELWEPLADLTGATTGVISLRHLPKLEELAVRADRLRGATNYRRDFLRDEDAGDLR